MRAAIFCVAFCFAIATAVPQVKPAWKVDVATWQTGGVLTVGPLAADTENVYFFNTQNNEAYALSIATGKSVWTTKISTLWNSLSIPSVQGEYVLFADHMMTDVYLLSTKNGAVLWTYNPTPSPGCLFASPIITPQGVLVSYGTNSICSSQTTPMTTVLLSLKDGSVIWKKSFGFGVEFQGAIQASDTDFWILTNLTSTYPGKYALSSYSLGTCTVQWEHDLPTPFEVLIDTMQYDPATKTLLALVHGTGGAFLTAFDTSNGVTRYFVPISESISTFAPLVQIVPNGAKKSWTVMTSGDPKNYNNIIVTKFDTLTGKQSWNMSIPVGSNIWYLATSATANSEVAVVAGDLTVYGISMATGEVVWTSSSFVSDLNWYRFVNGNNVMAIAALAVTNTTGSVVAFKFSP